MYRLFSGIALWLTRRWVLSQLPQRRQFPKLCPLFVLHLCCPLVFEFSVGIGVLCHRTEADLLLFSSDCKLGLRQPFDLSSPTDCADHNLLLRMPLDNFDIIIITTNICVLNFYDLSTWYGCWSFVSIWRFLYQILNACPFDCRIVARRGKVRPLILGDPQRSGDCRCCNRLSWVGPQSLCHRMFCGVFYVTKACTVCR